MDHKVVIFTDKSDISECLESLMVETFTQDTVHFVHIPLTGLYEFDYTQKGVFIGMPYMDEPKYQRLKNLLVLDRDGLFLDADNKTKKQIINGADSYIFTGSHLSQMIWNFSKLMLGAVGRDLIGKCSVLNLASTSSNKLSQADGLITPIGEERFKKLLNFEKSRVYFEYNFNVNSQLFLSEPLKDLGAYDENIILCKDSIQLLEFFTHHKNRMSHDETYRLMANWRGTGLYAAHRMMSKESIVPYQQEMTPCIGNEVTRPILLKNLISLGFLSDIEGHYAITDLGVKFVKSLHLLFNDIDLPLRLLDLFFGKRAWNSINRVIKILFYEQDRLYKKNKEIAELSACAT